MFDYIPVCIEYADTGTVNRIRAWARRNNATVHLTPYARGAYEGTVRVHTRWNEGRDQDLARVEALKALIRNGRPVATKGV